MFTDIEAKTYRRKIDMVNVRHHYKVLWQATIHHRKSQCRRLLTITVVGILIDANTVNFGLKLPVSLVRYISIYVYLFTDEKV